MSRDPTVNQNPSVKVVVTIDWEDRKAIVQGNCVELLTPVFPREMRAIAEFTTAVGNLVDKLRFGQ